MKELSSVHVGNGGILKRIQHASSSTNTTMTFGLFLPSSYVANHNDMLPNENTTPALFWLSGLTCDDTNFEMKAGPKAFEAAEKAVCRLYWNHLCFNLFRLSIFFWF